MRYKKHISLIGVLLLCTLIVHWYVFFDKGILNSGDWTYIYSDYLSQMWANGLWIPHSEIGRPVAFASNMPFYWLASALVNISPLFTWDFFTRYFFLGQIVILTPIAAYLFFYQVTKNTITSFAATSLYIFNAFFLRLQLDWLTYAAVWWILPSILFMYERSKLTKSRVSAIIIIGGLIFTGFVLEPRVMILITITYSFWFLLDIFFNIKKKKYVLQNVFIWFFSSLLGVIGHFFWVIPLFFLSSSNPFSYASNTVFLSFYSLQEVFSLRPYQWSQNLLQESFQRFPIDLRFLLLPFTVLIGFWTVSKKKRIDRIHLFFLVTFLVAAFLSKQEFSPLGSIYKILFDHLPLFNLYRESSKFLVIFALAYTFYFGQGVNFLYTKSILLKKNFRFLAMICLLLMIFFSTLFNSQNFFNQKIGRMSKAVEIPEAYLILADQLRNDPEFNRTLWVPRPSRWTYYSEYHSPVNFANLLENSQYLDFKGPFDYGLGVFYQEDFRNFLNASLVRYVVVPLDSPASNDSFYRHYIGREKIVTFLDSVYYLKRMKTNNDLVIYEVNSPDRRSSVGPLLSTSTYEVIDEQSGRWVIERKNVSEKESIVLSYKYDSGWKLYEGEVNWFTALLNQNRAIESQPSDHLVPLNQFSSIDVGQITFYYLPRAYMILTLYTSLFIIIGSVIFIKIVSPYVQ